MHEIVRRWVNLAVCGLVLFVFTALSLSFLVRAHEKERIAKEKLKEHLGEPADWQEHPR